ncbi:MAG: hypothetical protein H6815_05500 [Phycisphaeraceae bacterium]|nr:hypothetical protein [Phycisphaerales bacterium]MCB9859893.1 hypothetical protein [Phycisphaeraceae bacterium]
MNGAKYYKKKLIADGLLEFEMTAKSVAKAKLLRKKIVNQQKRLRQVKRQINLEMTEIRANYRAKTGAAGSGGSFLLSLLGSRREAGKWRADAKRSLQKERDKKLKPYDQVKLMIDDMLVQLDGAKLQTDQYIDEES